MKILVPVKRVPDPTQKAKLKDGHIDLTGASWIVNTFDEYAVETALRLVENGADGTRLPGAEIIVVSIGPDDAAKEIRTCLAMGADRAIHVVATDAEIDSLAVTKVLKGVVEAEKPDLVIMGKQAVDGDANQVGQMLAGKLGWPQATFAATVELAADKQSLLVGREVDGGVEYKRVPLHSVITVDLRIVGSKSVKNGVTPESHAYSGEGARLPSLKGIMAAKKKPMATAKLADYGVEAQPSIKELSVTLPPPRKAGEIVADIPTLVKKLADEAKAL
ncbi:MAG: electron transfer flavoprotein subunit beta/FixA family protein [Deltaproteobacteria bacterium]|nr:electron transfer flavoprotein subunit beta/FixA family protein [Deltaproteobacteria bacterium]MDQ3295919.1 electron transfer flavoprotein subunit beta/FixA family protein [Myxococcota bacterium]